MNKDERTEGASGDEAEIQAWNPEEAARALTDLRGELEWDGDKADAGEPQESADYVDGWNDCLGQALDLAVHLRSAMAKIDEPATALSAREMSDSFLLTLLSCGEARKGKLIDRIMEVAKSRATPGTYQVEIRVNGVEIDFREYASRISECIDDLVMSAAHEIFDPATRELQDATHEIAENAKHLASAFEDRMRAEWGMPRRNREDD
jgi:hypothetical protein